MTHSQRKARAFERNDYALRQVKPLENLFESCNTWSDRLENIAASSDPDHWKYIADEIQELKTALYTFGQAVVKTRNKNAEYASQQRRIIQSEPYIPTEGSRDNNDWLTGITDKIQETMATLNPGDFATIVVRKESSEDDYRDIIKSFSEDK